jgi:hypothetical protein
MEGRNPDRNLQHTAAGYGFSCVGQGSEDHHRPAIRLDDKRMESRALKKLYPHLDLDAEFCDATAWCMLHNRSLTNAFFLNWITKCDEKFAGRITFQPIKKEKWPAPAGRC